MKDATEVLVMMRSRWCQWPGMSPGHFLQLLALEVAVSDAEVMVATEYKQPLSILVHTADAEMAEAGRPCLLFDPKAGVEVA